MRKPLTVIVIYGLLLLSLPPAPAQKTQAPQGGRNASAPPAAEAGTSFDLSDVVKEKKSRKGAAAAAQAENTAARNGATLKQGSPAPASAAAGSPSWQSQEQGIASSVVASGVAEARSGVVETNQSQGPVYSEAPPLTPEEVEGLRQGFKRVNKTVPVRPGGTRKVIDKPIDPPTEVNRPTAALMRADTLKERVKARAADPDASAQAPNDFIYGTVRDIPTSAAIERLAIHEPSVANMGNTIFYTGNRYAARSNDGGQTFTYVNPRNTLPPVNRGFCCDQVANYAPAQDMLLWALQYYSDGNSGTLRLARAIGSTAVVNNQWLYNDFNPQTFDFPLGHWMDFPNMTVGSAFLYLTSNVFDRSDNFAGSVIWRISLAQLASGGPISYSYLSRTDVGALRTTEGAKTTMYWGTHLSPSRVRIYRWEDSGTLIFSDDIDINPYVYMRHEDPGVAISPDGTNWAERSDSRILGAWVSQGAIGLMWGARQDSQFPYPYTIVARFSEGTRALISQNYIWNSQFAWLYPTASVNAAGNVAGLLMYGGGPLYPGANIWISDDVQSGFAPLTAYGASESNRGPSRNVWGDYHTVRPHRDSPNTWVAATYYILNGGDDANAVPRYLWFGRERDFSCTFSISPASQSFGSGGGSGAVGVTASSAGCSRTAVSNANWLTVTSGASGTGNGAVGFSVTPNAAPSQRVGTLTVAGRTFTVTQAASSCAFSISPASQSFGSGGGSGSIGVTTGAGCAWASLSDSDWINITSGASGSGSGAVGFSVAPNADATSRTGTITAAGRVFTVTQAARSGCPQAPIGFGATVSGSLAVPDCALNDGSLYDTYTFGGTAGRQVSISMSSSAFDTYLFLLAPNGSVLALDDDGGGGTNSRIPAGTGSLTLPTSGTYRILANSYSAGMSGGYTLRLTGVAGVKASYVSQSGDFDGDGRADVAVWRASTGAWFIKGSTGAESVVGWGSGGAGDQPVAADYDGDRRADVAVWRSSTGAWFIINSSNGSHRIQGWGAPGDVPVPADYDGDGRADLAVWRPASGAWFIIDSSTGAQRAPGWGTEQLGDVPVPADYDGDGRADLAVWRPSSGLWFISATSAGQVARGWGAPGDVPVPADYDGDGRADLAVWRPASGAWFIIDSSTGGQRGPGWGTVGDTPVPGDYDGDGRDDLAVWRGPSGAWFFIDSATGGQRALGWGFEGLGDTPVSALLVRR